MAKSRHIFAGISLALMLGGPVLADPPTTAVIGTPPQPGWSLLSTQQKIILAPLAAEWDNLENIRRKKWLLIADRFPKMSQEEQQRVQQRMRDWARLTPEQRSKVRDSYKEFNQLPQDQKQALKQKWDQYSNLSEEEKTRLKQGAKPAGETPATPAPASEPTGKPQ